MAQLFGGGAKPRVVQPSPAPQVDDAVARLNAEDAMSRRQGRRTTIMTSDRGLPDLGSTTRTGQ